MTYYGGDPSFSVKRDPELHPGGIKVSRHMRDTREVGVTLDPPPGMTEKDVVVSRDALGHISVRRC